MWETGFYLEGEGLVESWVKRFLMDLGVKLMLLVWEDENLNVGIGGSTTIHGDQVCCLQDTNREL